MIFFSNYLQGKAIFKIMMIASERHPQYLSKTILTSLAPCEEIAEFCHTKIYQ